MEGYVPVTRNRLDVPGKVFAQNNNASMTANVFQELAKNTDGWPISDDVVGNEDVFNPKFSKCLYGIRCMCDVVNLEFDQVNTVRVRRRMTRSEKGSTKIEEHDTFLIEEHAMFIVLSEEHETSFVLLLLHGS